MNTIIWDKSVSSIIKLNVNNKSKYSNGQYYYIYKDNGVTEQLFLAFPYYPDLFKPQEYRVIVYSKVVEVMYDLEPRRP